MNRLNEWMRVDVCIAFFNNFHPHPALPLKGRVWEGVNVHS